MPKLTLSRVSDLLSTHDVEHVELRGALGIPLRRGWAPDLYVRSCAKGVVARYFDSDVEDQILNEYQILTNEYQAHTFAAEMARVQASS